MTILDNDCDLPPPDLSAPNLPLTGAQGRIAYQSKLYSWIMVHGKVVRLLRDSPYLTQEEIEKIDDMIQVQSERMPTVVSYHADSTLNPAWYLDSHIFVQNTKLRIYRHNLTPNAPIDARFAAMRSCIELAKEASNQIAKIFKDPDDPQFSPEGAHGYNLRVIRIVYPEHCQYMFSCSMYLVIAKMWGLALPLIIGLRAVANKSPVNKCCCVGIYGV